MTVCLKFMFTLLLCKLSITYTLETPVLIDHLLINRRNQIREDSEKYSDSTFDGLVARYEIPNGSNRYD